MGKNSGIEWTDATKIGSSGTLRRRHECEGLLTVNSHETPSAFSGAFEFLLGEMRHGPRQNYAESTASTGLRVLGRGGRKGLKSP